MRGWLLSLLLLCCSCGRLGFEPLAAGSDGDGDGDGAAGGGNGGGSEWDPPLEFDPLSCSFADCDACAVEDACCFRTLDEMQCPVGCDCYQACPDSTGCVLQCYGNSQCFIDASRAFGATVHCWDQANCTVNCTENMMCLLRILNTEARGLLICADSPGSCEMTDCAEPLSCAGDIVVCNRACPP